MQSISGIVPTASEVVYLDSSFNIRKPTEIEGLTALLFDTVYLNGLQFGADIHDSSMQELYPVVLGHSFKVARFFVPHYKNPVLKGLVFSPEFIGDTDIIRVATDETGELWIGENNASNAQEERIASKVATLIDEQRKRRQSSIDK